MKNRARMSLLRSSIRTAWAQYTGSLGHISQGCNVTPANAEDAFQLTDMGKVIEVTIQPIVFRLTKTANSPKSQIFVTVQGKVAFSCESGVDALLASDFKTQVGYFQVNGNSLDHVFGVHFDYDDTLVAHPVFHAQMTSCATDLTHVTSAYDVNYRLRNDCMTGVDGRIRIPTAHMDAFPFSFSSCRIT